MSCTGVLAGKIAASYGATQIARAIACKGECNVVLATGASQFEVSGRGYGTPASWNPYKDAPDTSQLRFHRLVKSDVLSLGRIHRNRRFSPGIICQVENTLIN